MQKKREYLEKENEMKGLRLPERIVHYGYKRRMRALFPGGGPNLFSSNEGVT